MRLRHTISVDEEKYQKIVLNKSKYEAKHEKTFKTMGDYLFEVSEMLA